MTLWLLSNYQTQIRAKARMNHDIEQLTLGMCVMVYVCLLL